MNNIPLSSIADLSTIIASVVAVLALCISTLQFYYTQKSTRESQAVELFLKWNQLNIDQEKKAAEEGNMHINESNHWYGNCKMAITEALFETSHQSPAWKCTVGWMLQMQRDFIQEGGFDIHTYSPKFRAFCKGAGLDLKSSRL